MPSSGLPTTNADALRTFVLGNEQLRSYLTSGNGHRLREAGQSFATATSLDPGFQLALFYRSLVQSELREADSAIRGFSELLAEGVQFQTEVLIHLAYAHIKRYEDSGYFEAERLFNKAREEAAKRGRRDLQLLIDSLKVFLYAVMGGRLSAVEQRPSYLDKALHLGNGLLEQVLRHPKGAEQNEARFEVLNGLGIAHMRKGAAASDVSEKRDQWHAAEECFKKALDLRPTAVRAMQNMGSLTGMEAFDARELDGRADSKLLGQAADWFLKSLALNSNDQFPHYKLSVLFALSADWPRAQTYFESGRQQSGAVKEKEWTKLQSAVANRDASDLRW